MKKLLLTTILASSLLGGNEITLVADSDKKMSYSGFGKLFGNKLMVLNISSEQAIMSGFIDDEWVDDFVCKKPDMKKIMINFNAKVLLIFKDKLKVYSKFSCIK